MLLARFQLGYLIQIMDRAIHADADQTGLADTGQHVVMGPFAAADHGGQNHGLGPLGQFEDMRLNLLDALLADGCTAVVAAGLPRRAISRRR